MASNTLAHRLEQALAHAGLTQTQVEQRGELGKGYLSRPLSGQRRRLDPEKLASIAAVCGVDAVWLGTGRGEMVGRGTKPEVRVEAERASAAPSETAQTAFEQAIARALDPERHTLRDVNAVVAALRGNAQLIASELDMIPAARRWLDAAVRLRRNDTAVTAAALLVELTKGATPAQEARLASADAAWNAEVKASLASKGIEPLAGKTPAQKIADRAREKRERE